MALKTRSSMALAVVPWAMMALACRPTGPSGGDPVGPDPASSVATTPGHSTRPNASEVDVELTDSPEPRGDISRPSTASQAAPGSRPHPFARYIAQMHRAIHDAWVWGFLERLDAEPADHPLNDENLWTRVEIVLHSDGRIDTLTTLRHSGKAAFDAAAREVVFAAGPFPDPPREIRSGNGKIYIHWAFHRDARACGTFGAEPFILDNAGPSNSPDPEPRVGRSEPESIGHRLDKP